MRILTVVLGCAMFALAACSSSQSGRGEADSVVAPAVKPQQGERNLDSLADLRRRHSPNVFRIVGTVTAIDPAGTGGATGPCAKAPCTASVRVDSLFYHDSSTAYPFGVGETVRMRFVFTLAPSRDLFPKLSTAYPGLKVGSSFEADVIRPPRKSGGAESDAPLFNIAAYTPR